MLDVGRFWSGTSPEILADCEHRLLSHVGSAYKVYPVPVQIESQLLCGPSNESIHTFELKGGGLKFSTPVVLVHGFASALGTFVNLFRELKKCCHSVYAIDLLGFGRSSKPVFPSDSFAAEGFFVDSIESWRIRMKLPAVVLCAHSFGAYIATNYAQKFPAVVKGLILFEPWGFRCTELSQRGWLHTFESAVNPLRLLKIAGPAAPFLMRLFTRELFQCTFAGIGKHDEMFMYLYHSNAQCTGDSGFMALKELNYRAKRPLSLLGLQCSVTLIFGADSWIYATVDLHALGEEAFIEIIPNAGHQLYAEQLDLFVCAVCKAMERV